MREKTPRIKEFPRSKQFGESGKEKLPYNRKNHSKAEQPWREKTAFNDTQLWHMDTMDICSCQSWKHLAESWLYILNLYSTHFLRLCSDPHKNQEGGWMMMNHVLHFHCPLSPPPLLGRNLSFSLSALHFTSLLPFLLLVTTWMCHCF